MARPKSKVREVEVDGPLAPFVAAYKLRLRESGYTPLTIVNELHQVAHMSRWMLAKHLAASELTIACIEEFLALRRATRCRSACSAPALVIMHEVLVERGVLPDRSPPPPKLPGESLLAKFHSYLLAERGLATGTAGAYVDRARRFLHGCPARLDLADLTVSEVTRSVKREAARVSVGSTQFFVAGLRAFLRFCFLEGLVGRDLSAAALSVTGRRLSSLPKGISGADVQRLLHSSDRRSADGRRDYAVLLLLVRLGLRASELAGLALEDIDWRAGEITVHGKGNHEDRLPLPTDVGQAISGYLRHGRKKTTRRELFLRSLAPTGPLRRGGVSSIVRRACLRAGIAPVGAHRLRHTLACNLLAAGAGLHEIGELLRHRDMTSTAIYARVDVETLRSLAQPWPGGGR